jgi:LacI family transcriptional regulator
MDRSANVTIRDVARRAAVSTATVSRALNAPQTVSQDVLLRVRAAIAALSYVPHRAARALASNQFGVVGAVMPTLEIPIFAKATQALQSRLNEHNYRLLVTSTDCNPSLEYSRLEALIAQGVDGIVLVGASHETRVHQLLEAKKTPYVNTWFYDESFPGPCVGFDNKRAMMRVVRHLYDLGHRKFAMIAGLTAHNDRAFERVAGVREALADRGLSLFPRHLIRRPYTFTDGRSALGMLLEKPNPPTAIICGNDILALGALFEALARGIRVPESLSITGFDDLEISSHTIPALTTVHVPAAEMGLHAADYLIALNTGSVAPERIELDAPLIVRSTTARAHPTDLKVAVSARKLSSQMLKL